MFRRQFSTAQALRSQAVQEVSNLVGGAKARKEGKRELIHKYVLNCSFLKNNTITTLSAVTEDLDFLKKNEGLSFNDKVLYYYNLPQFPKFTITAGSAGFRKSARGEYEAGFQVMSKAFQLMEQRGYLDKDIEVVMKNYGKGREAFFDALKGKEGDLIRDKIVRFADVTKIKFGGDRSRKQRRL